MHLLLLVLLLYGVDSPVSSLNEEGFALLSFKQSVTEDPEGCLNNWNVSDSSPCSWNGITCKEQRVISLSIPKKRLHGFLSAVLGSLSMLRHLNLRSNNLEGNLPVELFRAEGLQSLVLSDNSFTGSIPNDLGKLNYLQILDLSHNFFNGSLPKSTINCKRLKTLDLSQNNYTGSLPEGFGTSLSSLEKFDLSFNRFSGSIPSDIGNLSNLRGTVDFSHNDFSGSIPASLGILPEKVYIDLSYNNFSGSIPQNGALINRGPTAFIGNPGLCGPPLKNPCSSESPSSIPYIPDNSPTKNSDENQKARGLSPIAIIAIISSDVIGICLLGLLFAFCYSTLCKPKKSKEESSGYDNGKRGKVRKECLCFGKDESKALSDNIEQHDLVPLDPQVGFDLDELLKASAFVLGKSGMGIVYKVVLEDGLNLAVRRLGVGGSQRLKEFQTEVEAIGKLRHPNIVTLRAYYWSVDEKLLIYDYIPNGNLSTAIHGNHGTESFRPLNWSVRLKIMKGIAKGLVYLHDFSPKKYVHGDLKPSNILIGENSEPHISDFGLGRLANITGGSPTLQSSHVGSEKSRERPQKSNSLELATFGSTPGLSLGSCYQAPEALKVVKPSQKWDVYSYGIILLEMMTGKSPLVQMGSSEIDLVRWIQICIDEKKPVSGVLDPYLTREADKEEEIIAVLKIAMDCVHGAPEKRPTMKHASEALQKLAKSVD